jgi:hypothetical protein
MTIIAKTLPLKSPLPMRLHHGAFDTTRPVAPVGMNCFNVTPRTGGFLVQAQAIRAGGAGPVATKLSNLDVGLART